MREARKPWQTVLGVIVINTIGIWLLSAGSGLSQWWSKPPPAKPATEQVAHDPRNLPIGRYMFRTPDGTHGGATRSGGAQFRMLVLSDSVKWRTSMDTEVRPPAGTMNLSFHIDPVTERYASGPARPVNDAAIVTQENVLAFHDSLLFLRPLWLKDARGDYVEFTCGAGPALFGRLAEVKSISVLDVTNCRFSFRPRPDIYVMMQTIPGAKLPDFLKRIEDIYALVSKAIEISP